MDPQTRRQVRARAGHRCEYCQLTEAQSPLAKLQIEHVLPKKHGGTDDIENLALACIDCNLHKGANLTGIDPDTGQVTALFNPRSQRWEDHFKWDGLVLIGITVVGRTTIRVLDINADDRIHVRLTSPPAHPSPGP